MQQRVRAQLVVGSWAWCEHVTDREELERELREEEERELEQQLEAALAEEAVAVRVGPHYPASASYERRSE